jgi:hypothetical protein
MAMNWTKIADETEAAINSGACHPSMVATAMARVAEWRANAKTDAAIQASRSALISCAKKARAAGFAVKSSKDRRGNVSSYYLTRGLVKLRLSDHLLPPSPRREAMGTLPEFIVDADFNAAAFAEFIA